MFVHTPCQIPSVSCPSLGRSPAPPKRNQRPRQPDHEHSRRRRHVELRLQIHPGAHGRIRRLRHRRTRPGASKLSSTVCPSTMASLSTPCTPASLSVGRATPPAPPEPESDRAGRSWHVQEGPCARPPTRTSGWLRTARLLTSPSSRSVAQSGVVGRAVPSGPAHGDHGRSPTAICRSAVHSPGRPGAGVTCHPPDPRKHLTRGFKIGSRKPKRESMSTWISSSITTSLASHCTG